ncbi:hypothetical protein WMO79_01285 [Micrococcaceae bacterium Sec7.4]
MGSLDDAMVRAEKLGRRAADKGRASGKWPAVMTQVGTTRSGMSTGRLALDSFHEHGEDGMRAVMAGYQTGYRGRISELETGKAGRLLAGSTSREDAA